ncbi:hypothetical protein [Mesorhizobium loti]|uniref:hypothetical protein n=1 Tax=Rhizobium loti TaxID=381 RepID=UPI00041156F6|nr:hypothetical protein [Mesorhizobium loti]
MSVLRLTVVWHKDFAGGQPIAEALAAHFEGAEDEPNSSGFFERLAELSEEMVAKHGKDFSMGALVLAARWIAENRVGKLKTN